MFTRIIFNREHFIKLFDIRILISLISRDVRGSISHILVICLVLFTLPAVICGFNKKGSMETKHLHLSKIVHEHINRGECQNEMQEECFKPFTYLYISLHHSFISSIENKKYVNHMPNLEESVVSIKHAINKNLGIMPVYDQIKFRSLQWWKDCILEGIFPSREISIEEYVNSNNVIYLKEKNKEDIKNFFEFYREAKTWETFVSDSKKRKHLNSSVDLVFNSTEKQYLNRNKNFSEWLFEKRYINHIRINKQLLKNSSTFWNLSIFTEIKRNNINSNLFSNYLSEDSLILWMEKRFTKDITYIIDNLFSKEEKIIIDNFPKSFCYAFLDILSIDELGIGFHTTEEPNKKNSGFYKKYQNYSIRSDSNRLADVWNLKKKFKNFCLNCFVLPDAGSYTIRRKKLNINKLDLIIFMNWNICRNIFFCFDLFLTSVTKITYSTFFLNLKKDW